jgi:hypothetical protein
MFQLRRIAGEGDVQVALTTVDGVAEDWDADRSSTARAVGGERARHCHSDRLWAGRDDRHRVGHRLATLSAAVVKEAAAVSNDGSHRALADGEVDDTDMTPAQFRAASLRGRPVCVVTSRDEYEAALRGDSGGTDELNVRKP